MPSSQESGSLKMKGEQGGRRMKSWYGWEREHWHVNEGKDNLMQMNRLKALQMWPCFLRPFQEQCEVLTSDAQFKVKRIILYVITTIRAVSNEAMGGYTSHILTIKLYLP